MKVSRKLIGLASKRSPQLAQPLLVARRTLMTVPTPASIIRPVVGFSNQRMFSATANYEEMQDVNDWNKYLDSEIPVVLQAGASWCGPCGMLKPILTEAAKEFSGDVKYVYMDIDKFPEVAEMLEIQHIPKTFMVYNGELVDQFGGVPQDASKVRDFFQRAKDLASERE